MIAHHIAPFDAGAVHYAVVLRIERVVPADDVTKAESECICLSRNLVVAVFECGGIVSERWELIRIADLRVSDYNEIVAAVIAWVFPQSEIIAFPAVFDALPVTVIPATQR